MLIVRDLMQREVVTVTRETPVSKATAILRLRGFRHLPVLEKGELVGVFSFTDACHSEESAGHRQYCPYNRGDEEMILDSLTVEEEMSKLVITTKPDAPASEAARLMADQKIGCLPVVDKGKLVGIITTTDILRAFAREQEGRPKTEARAN
ncbi:MAG: CBS domain-containing protein [Deinococcus sp.]|nr:CBS domain-containing protein [Deinococcus sp.]